MSRIMVAWSGAAAELRDNPELVRQAYLAGDFHLDR
jgi:hypothetical protein